MVTRFEGNAARALDILENGLEESTQVLVLLERYRRFLRTTNTVERLNEEIRRRERVIRIFPNEASVLRLVGTGGVAREVDQRSLLFRHGGILELEAISGSLPRPPGLGRKDSSCMRPN